MISKLIFLVLCSTRVFSSEEYMKKIDPELLKSFDSKQIGGKENVMVSMTNGDTIPVLNSLNFPEDASKAERSEGVYQALTAHSSASQGSTLEFLSSTLNTGFTFDSSWISNTIYVKGADRQLVQSLASLPSVESIKSIPQINAIGSIKQIDQIQSKQRQTYWGVDNIEASDVWAQGVTGQGVRVMIIDTGLNVRHKDLRDNYVGDAYGWLDAVNNRPSAYDDHGHGSHCAGSVLGKNGMGVAPDAGMMGCKALDFRGSGGSDAFDKCAEYTISPNGDRSRGAHVVSNSWGGGQGTYFDKSIAAWREAGIIPVFAAGNDGRCNTIGYPGTNKDVITVGATAKDNSLAGFSSRGPGPNYEDGKNKPEVSAPGEDINSASHQGDGNAEMSGTSMACPHVAGLVALMMQDRLELEYDDIKTALQNSARTQVKSGGETCGGRRFPWERNSPRKRDNEFPNWHFGYGIVSAPQAMEELNNI